MKQRDCSSISQMQQQKVKLSFLVSWSFRVTLFKFQQHHLVRDRVTCYIQLGSDRNQIKDAFKISMEFHVTFKFGDGSTISECRPNTRVDSFWCVCISSLQRPSTSNTRNPSIIFIFIRAAAKIFALNGILPTIYLLLKSGQHFVKIRNEPFMIGMNSFKG